MFKTLLARGDRNGLCFAVIPGNTELDLKALAKGAGDRKIDLVPVKELQPLTGYIRGGVTALAARKDYPVFLDETAELFDLISVSAGQRGLQILVNPQDYLRITARYSGPWGHDAVTPRFVGEPIHISVRQDLCCARGRIVDERRHAVHAATFIRQRRIVLDAELLSSDDELRRILIHELFHFVGRALPIPSAGPSKASSPRNGLSRANSAGQPNTARAISLQATSGSALVNGGSTAAKPSVTPPLTSTPVPSVTANSPCLPPRAKKESPGSGRKPRSRNHPYIAATPRRTGHRFCGLQVMSHGPDEGPWLTSGG